MWTGGAGVTAISDYFGLLKMGKCRILWEKMRIVSKERDLAMEMCELCCCILRTIDDRSCKFEI